MWILRLTSHRPVRAPTEGNEHKTDSHRVDSEELRRGAPSMKFIGFHLRPKAVFSRRTLGFCLLESRRCAIQNRLLQKQHICSVKQTVIVNIAQNQLKWSWLNYPCHQAHQHDKITKVYQIV